MTTLIKPGTLLMGAACGCHATKGSICIIAATVKFTETSQSRPSMLQNYATPEECLYSCPISNFKLLQADKDDRIRPTLVNQDSTLEKISYDIFKKINLYRTMPGSFIQQYSGLIGSVSLKHIFIY